MNENKEGLKSFYIIMGRSGCGKGTQAELLKSFLEDKYEDKNRTKENVEVDNKKNREVLHITTGGNFREFIKADNYSANQTRETLNTGGLMPEFLAIWNWSNIFINNLSGNESVILDGAPRKLIEVEALNGALDFYGYKKVTVIYLNVSAGWAIDKLVTRGREDDDDRMEQERKMKWFDTDVMECIDLYKNMSENKNSTSNIEYNFIEINGEQSIDDVQVELISKLK